MATSLGFDEHALHFSPEVAKRVGVIRATGIVDDDVLSSACVVRAFVGSRPTNFHYIEHLDGDSSNCSLVNLAWVKRDWGARG